MDHGHQPVAVAEAEVPPPHVLIFPFPVQGHVNSMLKLAELLCLDGLHVTFLVTSHNHRRLLQHTNAQSRFAQYPGFSFETIPDGLPDDNPRSGDTVIKLLHCFRATAKPLLRDLLISDKQKYCNNNIINSNRKSITCIIADGILSFAIDVAEEIGIPIMSFRTTSACYLWALFCIPKLLEAGELPFKGNDDWDVPIAGIPGMEGILRRRDLPSYCRVEDMADVNFQLMMNATMQAPRAHALILNTFEEIEGPVLAQIRSQICPKVYTTGPLHAHLKSKLTTTATASSSNSLWEEDWSCMTWLDSQPSRSVIYVSFGSITMMTKDQLMEFWHGLVNSGKRFLWVIRPDSLVEKDQIPAELLEGTKEKGYMVDWAPQEEVLVHGAVGAFLTHSGWNSTLESLVAGVPMICWPYFADQQINSRFVGEVWKIGLDMKDSCERLIVETMVKDLMDVRRSEFEQSSDQVAKLATKAISEGGTSYCNLVRLIEDIRLMNLQSTSSFEIKGAEEV